jgi:hypothetical protein
MKKISYLLASAVSALAALAALTAHAATAKTNNEGFAAGQAAAAPSRPADAIVVSQRAREQVGGEVKKVQGKKIKAKGVDKTGGRAFKMDDVPGFSQFKEKEPGYGKPQPKVKVQDTFKKNQGVQKQKL